MRDYHYTWSRILKSFCIRSFILILLQYPAAFSVIFPWFDVKYCMVQVSEEFSFPCIFFDNIKLRLCFYQVTISVSPQFFLGLLHHCHHRNHIRHVLHFVHVIYDLIDRLRDCHLLLESLSEHHIVQHLNHCRFHESSPMHRVQ